MERRRRRKQRRVRYIRDVYTSSLKEESADLQANIVLIIKFNVQTLKFKDETDNPLALPCGRDGVRGM